MIEIEKPKIELIDSSEEKHYAKFVVEPLERGYGITLGNSLSLLYRERLFLRSKFKEFSMNFLRFLELSKT